MSAFISSTSLTFTTCVGPTTFLGRDKGGAAAALTAVGTTAIGVLKVQDVKNETVQLQEP